MSDVFVKAVCVEDDSQEPKNIYHCPVYRNRVSLHISDWYLILAFFFSSLVFAKLSACIHEEKF